MTSNADSNPITLTRSIAPAALVVNPISTYQGVGMTRGRGRGRGRSNQTVDAVNTANNTVSEPSLGRASPSRALSIQTEPTSSLVFNPRHETSPSIPDMLQVLGNLNVIPRQQPTRFNENEGNTVSAACTPTPQLEISASPAANYDDSSIVDPQYHDCLPADSTSKRKEVANVQATSKKRSKVSGDEDDGSDGSSEDQTANPFISEHSEDEDPSAPLTRSMRIRDPILRDIDTAAQENTSASKFFQSSKSRQIPGSAAAKTKNTTSTGKKGAPKKPARKASPRNPQTKRNGKS